MSVYLNDGQWERSNVVFSDGMVIRYEKGLTNIPSEMRYVDYGLSVFRTDNRRALDTARCQSSTC